MYFWDLYGLKARLIARPLTEREQVPYFLFFVAVQAIGENLTNELSNIWDYVAAVWSVIMTFGGAIYLYRQNGAGSGQHFLQRYFAVGLVVFVRWFVLMLIVLIPLVAVLTFADYLQDTTTWPEFAFFAIAELLLYQRVGHHIRDVALQTASRDA